MKLSKKFKERYSEFTALYDQDCLEVIEKYKLQPDDIEGAVILSVEEAKSINEAIEWLCSTLEDYERDYDSIPALIEGWNQMDFLEHRIEQVSKQST